MGRRTLVERSFQYIGPVSWNSLPPSIRHSSSLSSFKPKLKTRLFSSAYWSVVFFYCTNPLLLLLLLLLLLSLLLLLLLHTLLLLLLLRTLLLYLSAFSPCSDFACEFCCIPQLAAHLIFSLPTSRTLTSAWTGTTTTWSIRRLLGVGSFAQLFQHASTLKSGLVNSFQSATSQKSLLEMFHKISSHPSAGPSTNIIAPDCYRPSPRRLVCFDNDVLFRCIVRQSVSLAVHCLTVSLVFKNGNVIIKHRFWIIILPPCLFKVFSHKW